MMSEKYYVVSESELVNLRQTSFISGTLDVGERDDVEEMDKAEAACRAREVPKWATHFMKHDGHGFRSEDIKR